MKKLLFSTVAILALGAFANAGGGKLIEPPQVPPMAIDIWSGPYIGLQAGYIKGDGDTGFYDGSVKYMKVTNKPDGFIGGVYVGYNKLLQDNWLIGIELAANYTNVDETADVYYTNGRPAGHTFNLKQKNDFALYAKFGKVIDDTYMPYLLAGATMTKLEGTLTYKGIKETKSDTVNGFTVGAGLEFKINRNVHARVQYRYSKYQDAEYKFKYLGDTKTEYNTHSVMAGISYHF